MENLYLIKCNEYYKIGIATDLDSRVAALQTGNPYPLVVIACFRYHNAGVVEKAIHQKFADIRALGEWFKLGDGDVEDFLTLCRMLGGYEAIVSDELVSEAEIEEAEEIGSYAPTIEDVKRLMNDPNYRLEYRYGDNGLRGFAWRLRTGNKECPLYIGRRNPIFEEVRKIVPEHHPNGLGLS